MTTATDLADTVKAALTDTFEAPSRIARRTTHRGPSRETAPVGIDRGRSHPMRWMK